MTEPMCTAKAKGERAEGNLSPKITFFGGEMLERGNRMRTREPSTSAELIYCAVIKFSSLER